jgi:hypothetical protein
MWHPIGIGISIGIGLGLGIAIAIGIAIGIAIAIAIEYFSSSSGEPVGPGPTEQVSRSSGEQSKNRDVQSKTPAFSAVETASTSSSTSWKRS